MTLMFKDTDTTNPYTGCEHGCPWCYAEHLILEGRLKNLPKYRACGFLPTFHPEVLKGYSPRAKQLFVCSLGDLFGKWVSEEYQKAILRWLLRSNAQNILLLTKNPARYLEVLEWFVPDKRFVFGATIESTLSKKDRHGDLLGPRAPDPSERMFAMEKLRHDHPFVRRFVSVEPVLLFDRVELREWLRRIKPEFTYIGYDNHSWVPWWGQEKPFKVRELIEEVEDFTEVRPKNITGGGRE
jgi:DNA repair photolyase